MHHFQSSGSQVSPAFFVKTGSCVQEHALAIEGMGDFQLQLLES